MRLGAPTPVEIKSQLLVSRDRTLPSSCLPSALDSGKADSVTLRHTLFRVGKRYAFGIQLSDLFANLYFFTRLAIGLLICRTVRPSPEPGGLLV